MDKSGCGTSVFFIVLIFLMIGLNSTVFTVIVLIISLGYLILVFTPIVSRMKHSSKSSTPTSLKSDYSQDIDRDYFNQISKVVDDLMTVYDSAISSQEFRDAASDGFELHNGNQTIEDATSKIKYLFWIDMAHCGRGLHLPYDRLDKTSYALYYFMERTMGEEKLSYDNYRDLYRSSNHVMAGTALKECYFSCHDAEDSNFHCGGGRSGYAGNRIL